MEMESDLLSCCFAAPYRVVAWKTRNSILTLIEEAVAKKNVIILLGRLGSTYLCALELSRPIKIDDSEEYVELRPILPLLSQEDAALIGHVQITHTHTHTLNTHTHYRHPSVFSLNAVSLILYAFWLFLLLDSNCFLS
jgi:hypothetical protein